MYSWTALVTSQLLIELPWNILGSSLFFVCWYWTVGLDTEFVSSLVQVLAHLTFLPQSRWLYLPAVRRGIPHLLYNHWAGHCRDGSRCGNRCNLVQRVLLICPCLVSSSTGSSPKLILLTRT